MRGADLHLRMRALKVAEESRQVSEANGAGNPDAQNFRPEFKSSAQRFYRVCNAGKDGARSRIQRRAGRCQGYGTRGAFEERSSKASFHSGDLAGDGRLRESGGLAGFGEIAVFGDEMKELQFVEIERASGEQFIHGAHHCKTGNEFPAMPARGEDARV